MSYDCMICKGLKCFESHAAQIQHLYVTLGGKAGGQGRTTLAELKHDYGKHFKYEGKV